ncbi:UvrD-helicase domain-containing protein [Stappia indica]|uniref:UvrD-helicase domain-containing protein n=1 Tax=Stappia indica TaxID=538381 RepID=UPI001D1981A8|nr:ATP-dependent helicase [Stappia indica]MCC4242967.1 ATP-dependent helicase [Stappia indica]
MPVAPEDWRPQGVDDLEPRAWNALRETAQSVCVTAGAGAGKTEFLAQKAAYLLQTGLCPQPKRILAISFKRDAAQNLAARVRQRCSEEQARRFQSMTFDAFTKHMLDHFRLAIPEAYRPPADYSIAFPSRQDIELFLRRHGRPDVSADRFERAVARTALPLEETVENPRARELLRAYWEEQYTMPDGALLSFPMINRLVEYMLRSNPTIKRALRLTYPFVFLDEFQDTTYAQYSLVKGAFRDSNSVLTAVGDDKQKIMGWAGAMNNAFDEFVIDFNAVRHALLRNWRSHEALVAIQHVIARQIDPDVEEVEARGELAVEGDTAAIWRFDSREQEAEQIARWIRSEVDAGRIAPHDAAILVRMRANNVEDELAPVLRENGLILRNLARNVGGIAIQDLLAEPLTEVVLSLLKLGTSARDPDAWNTTQDHLQALAGTSPDDGTGQERLQREIAVFSRNLRQTMRDEPPGPAVADRLFAQTLEFTGVERLRQTYPEYRRDADFQRVRTGFQLLLRECTENAVDWISVLDRFEGKGQVPLMTIHKSKGLEFHTMIFFGLDAKSWWSLLPDHDEELKSFFVAFTRAKQRAFFAYCSERGNTIGWLEQLLLPAGVVQVDGADIVDPDA